VHVLFNKQTDLPIDQVRAMQAKGYDNNQIVQALQRNGYSSTQIFDALNQSDMASGAPGGQTPPSFAGAPIGQDSNPGMGPQYAQDYGNAGGGASNEEIEELVESIIEEKWNDLVKDINKIVEWKNDIEIKVTKLEQSFDNLKDEFDKVHQAIIGKIGEYDKNILEVGAEVRAMEKVFSKVLPVFTENVHELSKVTDAMTKSRPK